MQPCGAEKTSFKNTQILPTPLTIFPTFPRGTKCCSGLWAISTDFSTYSRESTGHNICFQDQYLSLDEGQTVPGPVQQLLHSFRIFHGPVLPEGIPYPPQSVRPTETRDQNNSLDVLHLLALAKVTATILGVKLAKKVNRLFANVSHSSHFWGDSAIAKNNAQKKKSDSA